MARSAGSRLPCIHLVSFDFIDQMFYVSAQTSESYVLFCVLCCDLFRLCHRALPLDLHFRHSRMMTDHAMDLLHLLIAFGLHHLLIHESVDHDILGDHHLASMAFTLAH